MNKTRSASQGKKTSKRGLLTKKTRIPSAVSEAAIRGDKIHIVEKATASQILESMNIGQSIQRAARKILRKLH